MGVDKFYKDSIKDTTQPIKGDLHLEGEDFEYEYFLLPIIGPNKSEIEKMLISRLGNRMQNGKKCLDIDEDLVATNIENDEYSSIVFIRNKQDDDVASGTMQYYDWCEKGKSKGTPQIWVNDLCRIATKKRQVSPVKALLLLFELIAAKYVRGVRYIHLMVDKEKPDEADLLTKIYGKYGYIIVDKMDCELEGGDEYILMKKKIDRNDVKKSVKLQSIRASPIKSKSKTKKVFSQEKPIIKTPSPIKEKTPSPIKEKTPSPIKEKTPSPIKETTPSPIKETTPKQKTPSPMK